MQVFYSLMQDNNDELLVSDDQTLFLKIKMFCVVLSEIFIPLILNHMISMGDYCFSFIVHYIGNSKYSLLLLIMSTTHIIRNQSFPCYI